MKQVLQREAMGTDDTYPSSTKSQRSKEDLVVLKQLSYLLTAVVCLCPLTIDMLKPHPQSDGIRRWGLGR